MNTNHEDRSLDAVLFRFHREVSTPTSEIVAAWRREYPEYASEIEAHAIEVLDMESRAGAEVPDMASLEIKARSAALNAVYEAKRRSASAPVECVSLREAAEQAGMQLRELADKMDIARSVVVDVNSGAIVPETIIAKFLRAAARLVRSDLESLRGMIAQSQPSGVRESIAFKATALPTAGKPRSWSEAINASDMPPDRKAYWLSEEE
ncbi:MAG: hypothetical protein WAV72_27280 [Bradyrhizobium sp.]